MEEISRRRFLNSVATGALGFASASFGFSSMASSDSLEIEIAGYEYDRVKALADGHVRIPGCNYTFVPSRIGDMNSHVFGGPQTHEVSEIGLHPFILAYANEGFRDYALLPIFPLRVFRHKSVFIRTDRGINEPKDLRGRRVATPGYSSTSLTWIRGVLQDEYGLRPEDIHWVVSAEDSSASASGGPSKQENMLPDELSVSTGPEGMDESDLLESGKVDALFHAAEPRAWIERHPKVARLFPDSRTVEQAYYRKTGIFPIMHAVAMRKDVLEAEPWLARSIFDAYSEAKEATYKYLYQKAWYLSSIPWIAQEMESTADILGRNYWTQGVEPNRGALEALFRYSYEQGMAQRRLTVEELFYQPSLEFSEATG